VLDEGNVHGERRGARIGKVGGSVERVDDPAPRVVVSVAAIVALLGQHCVVGSGRGQGVDQHVVTEGIGTGLDVPPRSAFARPTVARHDQPRPDVDREMLGERVVVERGEGAG
jgi:hypothetical protein